MNGLKGSKLLVLGGNALSCDIVRAAESMGLYTIVTDWNSTKDSPAKLLADEYWNVSLMDYDRLIELIKEKGISGVITGFTDSYLLPYQHLCELAGLPCYATAEQFAQTLDKAVFKEQCKLSGVPVVPEYDLESFDPSGISAKNKVIIKPVDNSGSRGIFICEDPHSFKEQVENSLSYSKSGHVLIEKYMECDDVSFEYKIQDGEAFLSSICDRYIFKTASRGSVTSKLIYPSSYTERYLATVDANVKDMLGRMGLRNGVLFLQAFADEEGFYFYEMGYRLSGGRHFIFTENQNNSSSVKELIRFALTGSMAEERLSEINDPMFKDVCSQLSVLCRSEYIDRIVGREWIAGKEEIVDALYTYDEGDTVGEMGTSAQIAARFHIVARNMEHLDALTAEIQDRFRILNREGENIILWENQ